MSEEVQRKTVTIKATVLFQHSVPEDWDDDLIDFHFNGSSLCAGDLFKEKLLEFEEKAQCLCGHVKFKLVP